MLTVSIFTRIIYLLIGAAVVGVFAGVLVLIVKKGNKKFDEAFAKIPQDDLDKIKNTDYHNYEADPKCFVALAVVTDVVKIMQDKVKLEIIFFNNVTRQYMLDEVFADKAVFEQRGIQNGSLVQVILKEKEALIRAQGVI